MADVKVVRFEFPGAVNGVIAFNLFEFAASSIGYPMRQRTKANHRMVHRYFPEINHGMVTHAIYSWSLERKLNRLLAKRSVRPANHRRLSGRLYDYEMVLDKTCKEFWLWSYDKDSDVEKDLRDLKKEMLKHYDNPQMYSDFFFA